MPSTLPIPVSTNLLHILIFFDKDLPSQLIKDIQDFTKHLFLSGQSDLQTREHDVSEKDEQENESGSPLINRFKLNVQTNAVCVDILVWATKDEQGKYNLQTFS